MNELNPRVLITLLCGFCLVACGPDGGTSGGTTPLQPLADDGTLMPDVMVDADPVADAAPDGQPDPPDLPVDGTDPEPDLPVGTTDEGVSMDVPADPGPPDTSGEEGFGSGILLFQLESDIVNIAGAGARFTDPIDLTNPDATQFGDCFAAPTDPDAPGAPANYGYDAGAITLTNLAMAVTLSPVDEGADGTGYESGLESDLTTIYGAGLALILVEGAGGAEVEAFSTAIQTPQPVTMTAPSTGFLETLSTGADRSVTWQVATGTNVLVTLTPLSAAFAPEAGNAVTCFVEGDPGSLVIPAGALEMARNGSSSQRVAIGVTRATVKTTAAGSSTVQVTVSRSTAGLVSLTP